ELLWPARFDRASVDELKRRLGPTAAVGHLQQRPVPAGGGFFKRAWFAVLPTMPAAGQERCRVWDCAATPGRGDWGVGVKMARTAEGQYIVEDVVRGQWSPGDVDRIMRQTAQSDGRTVPIREEQEPGSAGKAVVAARTRLLAGFDYRGESATGDKTTR